MGIKDHVCSECGQAFTEKRYRDDHYNVKHLGLKTHPCEQCGKLFGSYNSLSAHKKSIHGTAPNPKSKGMPQSPNVRKSFEIKPILNVLLQVQTEFPCDVCGKTYKSKGARNTHYDKAHLGDKKLPCEECGLVFERSGALQVHMAKMHPTVLDNDMSQGMPCDVCGLFFGRSCDLQIHVTKMHSQARVNE